MLDNYNGIAGISEPVEYAYELIYVVAVKPRRRLVQNVKRFTRGTFGKLGCKLNSLRFAARKRGCGLTEFNISETYVLQGFYLVVNSRYILEIFHCLVDRHIENVRNVFAFKLNLERFVIVSFALALFTRNENVGKKMHFDFYDSVALTFFASAAGYVERKSSRLISSFFRVVGSGENLSDISKRARIRRGVRSRRSAYRRLVYRDHLIEIIHALDFIALSVTDFRAVEFVRHYR